MATEINQSTVQTIGQNLATAQTTDGKLVLIIDLSKTVGLSSTGKMMGIASTGGFAPLAIPSPRGKRISLNLYLGER